jgi:Fe-S cluster biogenesis protein NfuA
MQTTDTPASVDRAKLEARARLVSRLLAAHGGGVEVVDAGPDGAVRLSFTGLCTACWMRPLTLENVVGPAFRDLDGVADVQADGVRISAAAQQWLSQASARRDGVQAMSG